MAVFHYKSIELPEQTLIEMMMESVTTYKDNVAITFAGKTFTYETLFDLSKRVATGLAEQGVNKGDRIGLMLPNCPQYVISYFATLYLGATVVQINPLYKPAELAHVLKDAEVKAIIMLDQLVPVYEVIKNETQVILVAAVSFEGSGSFDLLLNSIPLKKPEEVDPVEDVAVIQYTGGTTGRSKGAMLTHYNLVSNTLQTAATQESNQGEGSERVLTIIPLFHVYGMTSAMNLTLFLGGNMILLPRFDVEETAKAIEMYRPTSFPGVPTMYIALLDYFRKHHMDLSMLNVCTSGSAPMPVEVMRQFNELTGTTILEGFGLSEASPVTHRNPLQGKQKAGSIGVSLPNTESKIVDIATEQELKANEVGELIIRGPQIMKGYYNLSQETANALRNGWLFTGDLARRDEDGYFYIVGRKKELIIASGYNVYPIEIEDVLYRMEGIQEAAVIGVPDEYRGETVKAFIVKKQGSQLSEEDIVEHCKQHLAAFKIPKQIAFIKELPKTAVGKILKRELVRAQIKN
ncbi:long-chain-fatty-acid--CoA ligase [Shouchella patagoniensis]|uniref:long-chain-fatty-acid--CoA ligase n=1 Tax=Shouchella patagoniensis TaxID=228576 RepID=UPI0009957619|nr:long-chain fatty acid--CoA ligase [Shouchella patagoniensis]